MASSMLTVPVIAPKAARPSTIAVGPCSRSTHGSASTTTRPARASAQYDGRRTSPCVWTPRRSASIRLAETTCAVCWLARGRTTIPSTKPRSAPSGKRRESTWMPDPPLASGEVDGRVVERAEAVLLGAAIRRERRCRDRRLAFEGERKREREVLRDQVEREQRLVADGGRMRGIDVRQRIARAQNARVAGRRPQELVQQN